MSRKSSSKATIILPEERHQHENKRKKHVAARVSDSMPVYSSKACLLILQISLAYYLVWMIAIPLLEEDTFGIVRQYFPPPIIGWCIPASLLLAIGFACWLEYPGREKVLPPLESIALHHQQK